MTKQIPCSDKTHRKIKRLANDADKSMKDFMDDKFRILTLVLLVGTLTFGSAYAVEVDLPLKEEFDDSFCSLQKEGNHVKFSCYWRWFFPDYIMKGIENDTTIPSQITDLPQHNLDLADKIRLLLERGAPAEVIPDDSPVIDDAPKEPLTREEREIEAAVKTLAECRTGLGAWAAYQEQELIEHYSDQTRWEFAIRDNLSQSPIIGKMLKAIEECRIMKKYADMNLIGAYELNKVLADLAGLDYLGRGAEHPLAQKVTDQSDAMVATDPVTDKDIADEIEDMERIRDELIEQRVFEDPDADFTGENRGFQPAGARCQVFGQPAPVGVWATEKCPLSLYEAHILKNWDDITYSDILTLQCDNFLYVYQHKIGTDDFPKWLNHCVPKVVRN
jgi:hypothetical protein